MHLHGKQRQFRVNNLQQLRIVYANDIAKIGIPAVTMLRVQTFHDTAGEECYLLDEIIDAWKEIEEEGGE